MKPFRFVSPLMRRGGVHRGEQPAAGYGGNLGYCSSLTLSPLRFPEFSSFRHKHERSKAVLPVSQLHRRPRPLVPTSRDPFFAVCFPLPFVFSLGCNWNASLEKALQFRKLRQTLHAGLARVTISNDVELWLETYAAPLARRSTPSRNARTENRPPCAAPNATRHSRFGLRPRPRRPLPRPRPSSRRPAQLVQRPRQLLPRRGSPTQSRRRQKA